MKYVGEPGKMTKKPIDSSASGSKKENSKKEKDVCTYNCQESGGCSVRIVSKSFVSGATMGSCFSESFGGSCSGIPKRCEKCLDVCKGKSGDQFSLPASNNWGYILWIRFVFKMNLPHRSTFLNELLKPNR